jgi:hypothetical protein
MSDTGKWSTSHTEFGAVTPSAVWAVMSDVASWPEWNEDIEEIAIDGAFTVGAAIVMRPRDQPTVRLRLTEIEPGTSFVDEAEVAGTRVRTHHEVVPTAEHGVRVTYRLCATGPAAQPLGRAITADFGEVIRGLIAYVAQRQG